MESLTVSCINQSIDEVIHEAPWQKEGSMSLRRATTSKEWNSMLAMVSDQSSLDLMTTAIPFYFGIGLLARDDTICGVITFYLAYSTWEGRNLFVDRLECPVGKDDAMEKSLLRLLAKIAVKLDCTRLTWRHTETPSWYVNGPNPPEILHEWLTLRMDRPAMEKYVDESNITRESRVIQAGTFTRDLVEKTVMNCLEGVNNSRKSKFQLRLAGEGDVDTIARLVQGLAVYEKEPEAVNITANHYLRDGSGSEEPLFYCLMLDQAGDNEHIYTCGMALVYFGYTLGEGRFLYLEDLFLEEAYRKQGGGSLAMQTLARLSLALACSQFYWCALDWNTPALNLYNKIGAKVQEGLLTTRYTGEALTSFASDE